jgi:hypothetical protein
MEGFLKAFSTRVVHTFFKRGDASEFDNYKGIMVGPIVAKLFAMILDKRLNKMGYIPSVKLGFAKIIALLTKSSYCGL